MTTTRAVWVKREAPTIKLLLVPKPEDIPSYDNPLRGIFYGCLFSGAIWIAIFLGWVMWRLYRG